MLVNIFVILMTMTAAVAGIVVEGNPKDHWAVILVGSKSWENYRHQADGCHAYHIFKQNGIPED